MLERELRSRNDGEILSMVEDVKRRIELQKSNITKLKYIRGRLSQLFHRVFRSPDNSFESEKVLFDKYNYWRAQTATMKKNLSKEEEASTLVQLIISTFVKKVHEHSTSSSTRIKFEPQLIEYLFSHYRAAKLLNSALSNDLLPGITVGPNLTCPSWYLKNTYTVDQLCHTIEKQKIILKYLTSSINTMKRQLKDQTQELKTYLLDLENEQRRILRSLMITWEGSTEDLPPDYDADLPTVQEPEDIEEEIPLGTIVGPSHNLSITIPNRSNSNPLSPVIDFRSPFSPDDSDDEIPLAERFSNCYIPQLLPAVNDETSQTANIETGNTFSNTSPAPHSSLPIQNEREINSSEIDNVNNTPPEAERNSQVNAIARENDDRMSIQENDDEPLGNYIPRQPIIDSSSSLINSPLSEALNITVETQAVVVNNHDVDMEEDSAGKMMETEGNQQVLEDSAAAAAGETAPGVISNEGEGNCVYDSEDEEPLSIRISRLPLVSSQPDNNADLVIPSASTVDNVDETCVNDSDDEVPIAIRLTKLPQNILLRTVDDYGMAVVPEIAQSAELNDRSIELEPFETIDASQLIDIIPPMSPSPEETITTNNNE
ncbi:hypothetical protein HK103_007366 [Boothiomyces macroporosus]|uniref:Uncharacterized protein n=1 Tax=Boothiomyces macroporosus TaxID=261099 RepID=A0AAD5UNH0_9FUNG|nr:hypothetical protein HK103_007366 [Boothiomyces macroporosus]